MTTEKKPIQVKSPFKLLDPYLEKDHHVFFGREIEEEKIFEHIKRNKILLLYGPSGAGKTSLIQCGLAHRLKVSGWTPVLVRRNENINTSLVNAVEEALLLLIKSIPSEEQMDTGIDSINKQDLIEKISVLHAFYRRPVHLIFDQFEEFLIMATANERETFLTILKSLFAILSGVSIIIVLREEYFGYFDRFQEAIPGLAEKRIWIDPMSTTKIKKVISELLSAFEISLQDPEKNIDQIIDALKNKKGEVSLAHLQIYLDQFWRADYNRDYPNGHEGDAWQPLTFTTAEIKEFGSIENVLQRFLSERKTILLDMIKSKFPGTDDAFLTKVLDEFVTEFGTKQPVNFEVPDGLHYFFKGKTVEQLNKFDKPTLHYTIGLLQENGILRIKGRRMELTHDSLAKLIHDQRDARKKKQIRIRQRLKIHIEDKRQLTIEDVNDWNSYMDSIFFSPAELKYFHDSKRKREEEIFFQKVKTRRNKIAFIVLSAFSVIAILAVLLYKNQSQNWELRKSGYALAYLSKLDTMQNPTEALTIAQYIYSYMDGDSLKQGAVREKMNILMRKESFQNMFAYFKHPISIDSSGEIDFAEFSTSGEFAIVGIKNTYMSQQSGYVVVYGKNSTDTLRNCNSVFFLRNKDKIILTYNDNRTFCLYDCATKKRHDTINLSFASKSSQILTYPDAWLDSPNTLIFSIADTIDNNRSEKYRLVSYDLSAKKTNYDFSTSKFKRIKLQRAISDTNPR